MSQGPFTTAIFKFPETMRSKFMNHVNHNAIFASYFDGHIVREKEEPIYATIEPSPIPTSTSAGGRSMSTSQSAEVNFSITKQPTNSSSEVTQMSEMSELGMAENASGESGREPSRVERPDGNGYGQETKLQLDELLKTFDKLLKKFDNSISKLEGVATTPREFQFRFQLQLQEKFKYHLRFRIFNIRFRNSPGVKYREI